ncbi:uncharacterized protein K460DRAFT_407614 [Cucurbitaria berberidis CBS 394.84]|uniref:Uncharacterized protein n=1 Tax=Cucurbitaria berberidis CBS 394.84 TaxID=1168544 RepID=A0A9P4L6N3_9PLEO|nr:uncharacterized protein K460DRAFT_407614 [Cucurbitaria berberidis CBS 394.84]KAF1843248.1 hypothetical protein K460DRAFT_407614 [Cucurbitaria berberidis CBS 394.84]
MDNSAPSPPLSLEEVLEIYLLCFEAAVAALPPFSLAYAMSCQYDDVDVPVWMLWDTDDLDDPPADPFSLSFPPEYVVDGLMKKDMCDWFCFLLESEVDRKLRELFGARVRWLQCCPRIPFLLATRSGEHQLEIPTHSVLLVTRCDGRMAVMDGTLQQFGWPRETWLQSWNDFLTTRVNTREQPCYLFASDEDRESARELATETDGGFWEVAQERMTELFGELDWEELKNLGTVERVERVKRQAEDKFAGANEEACERYDREQGRE